MATFSLLIGTARIVQGAVSMKRYSDRPSVSLSNHGPTAANPLLQVCSCGLAGRRSIDCCSGGGQYVRTYSCR